MTTLTADCHCGASLSRLPLRGWLRPLLPLQRFAWRVRHLRHSASWRLLPSCLGPRLENFLWRREGQCSSDTIISTVFVTKSLFCVYSFYGLSNFLLYFVCKVSCFSLKLHWFDWTYMVAHRTTWDENKKEILFTSDRHGILHLVAEVRIGLFTF